MREELVQTAVKFLRDEKVASSPLAKRISFLESKGLSQNEIEEALSRSKGDENKSVSGQSTSAVITGPPPLPPPRIVHARPALYQFVILAIAAGGLSSLFQTLIQKYPLPAWLIPSWLRGGGGSSKKSKEEIVNDRLDGVEENVRKLNEAHEESVAVLKEMQGILKESLMEYKNKMQSMEGNEEMKELKKELEKIGELIPSIVQQSNIFSTNLIQDLKNEIAAIKSSSRPTSVTEKMVNDSVVDVTAVADAEDHDHDDHDDDDEDRQKINETVTTVSKDDAHSDLNETIPKWQDKLIEKLIEEQSKPSLEE